MGVLGLAAVLIVAGVLIAPWLAGEGLPEGPPGGPPARTAADELRRAKPEPRSEFVLTLAERLRAQRHGARPVRRMALAAALTTALLAALAPVGALGSAASSET